MLVVEKYRCNREVGWSDDAEVHAGPPDDTHRVPIAVKIRHGLPGPPRPDGRRDRFLRAANDQQAAVLAGCKSVAPIFETGQEGNNAYYVSQQYPRSIDSLIQGRVALDPNSLHRLTDRILKTLEDLRDKHGRAHGNLKPANIFLDGKGAASAATIILGDLAIREEGTNQGTDCYALGAVLYQLIRGRTVRHFDWPMVHGPDWDKLGPAADGWREFCNVLMAPETSANPDALTSGRQAFKNMRRLAAAGRRNVTANAAASGDGSGYKQPTSKGLLAGIGTAVMAGVGALVIALQPADSSAKSYLRTLPVVGLYAARLFPQPTATPTPTPPDTSDELAEAKVAPTDTPELDPPTPTLTPTPPSTPTVPPTPTPVPTPTYIGYRASLSTFREHVYAPEMVDAPENITGHLRTLKEDIGFNHNLDGDAKVAAFVKKLPAQIPASNSVPELPSDRWTKETASREGDLQSVVYHWNSAPQMRMQFNRVNPANGGQAFYLSATTVPLRLGAQLARVADPEGRAPLKGYVLPNGPVAGQFLNGQYILRPYWITHEGPNATAYAENKERPSEDSPMNGLSGNDAAQLARAAGCALPTLAQWDAVMQSPSGEEWQRRYVNDAKVRGAQWSQFAKTTKAFALANTGTRLPNDQCFGDKTNLEPVTTAGNSDLFFEPVGQRPIAGYSHLIGNVGQYVADGAKFCFAGGSAESPPDVFAKLLTPPVVPNAFVAYADAGFRLAANAKGNGSDQTKPLEKLKADLDAEIARAGKLP